VEVDPRLVGALERQLRARRATLAAGARHVGWKLGIGDAERIGTGPAVGHLTSASQHEPGGTFAASGAVALHADVELAVELAGDAIGRFAPALELVDLVGDDAEEIVAANVFHRGFAIGTPAPPVALEGVLGRLLVDGETRAVAPVEDVHERLAAAADVLAAAGEAMRAGDWVITGSIVQAPVVPGSRVRADLGPLGAVELAIA
jgi:2-keto-4-pentenoate hydratase